MPWARLLRKPHVMVMTLVAAAIVAWCIGSMRWDWIQKYWDNGLILEGLRNTMSLLAVSWILGLLIAVFLGLAQAAGPWYLALPAKGFCSIIRGTPLLLQVWMFYYGFGSLFPQFPWIRESFLWPYLREAWPYALTALTLSFAGYEGEIMRGAFLGVPSGQLEAARAFGMPRFTILRRIWLPQAFRRALPTLGGETVQLLKATPLVATITVADLYAVASRIRQDTYVIYPPLLLLALSYMVITGCIVLVFTMVERRVPSKLG